jgi:hypothetical protein
LAVILWKEVIVIVLVPVEIPEETAREIVHITLIYPLILAWRVIICLITQSVLWKNNIVIVGIHVYIWIVAIVVIEMPDIIVGLVSTIGVVGIIVEFPSPGDWYLAFIVSITIPWLIDVSCVKVLKTILIPALTIIFIATIWPVRNWSCITISTTWI